MLSICELQNLINKSIKFTNKTTGTHWISLVDYFTIYSDGIYCTSHTKSNTIFEISLDLFDISLQS